MFKVSSQSFSNVDKMSNLFYFKRCNKKCKVDRVTTSNMITVIRERFLNKNTTTTRTSRKMAPRKF